jgi:DNA-binding MarR family transcriptional regulator
MQVDDERYLGYLFTDVARLMRTVFDRRVRSLGLTRAQWLVLSRLHRSPGLSQVELADLMEVEKATAGKHIDRLELKGWVERRPDPADRRIKRLYLTPIAQRVQKKMWRIAEATVDDAVADLTPAEAKVLVRHMTRVKARLQDLALNDGAARGGAPAHRTARKRTTDRRGNGHAARSHRQSSDADEALVS